MAAPTARATAPSTMTKVRSEVRASDLVVGASATIHLEASAVEERLTVLKGSKEGASRCRVKINLVTTAGRKLIRSLDTSNDSQIEVSGQGDSSASTLSKGN